MESIHFIILKTLNRIEKGKSLKKALRNSVSFFNLKREDESILYFYVYEIYRKLNVIDLYIKQSSFSYSLKQLDIKTKSLLRLATFLLKFDKKDEEEVIEALHSFYDPIENLGFRKVINLIVSITHKKLYKNRIDKASRISLENFTPTWIVRKLLEKWDENFVSKLLDSFLLKLPTYVRVNTLKTTFSEICHIFKEKNIAFEKIKTIPNLIKIVSTKIPIPRLSEFKEGQIVIQQKASALVALVLNPKPNEKILDMCASPGGKTSHIAAIVGTGKDITALDINRERIGLLQERLRLLGIESTKVKQQDARVFYEISEDKYDKILLDPPCSGSGTYSSRPENKWRLKPRDLRWYVTQQKALLLSASKLVKPKGNIVYSTCSIFTEENQNIISSFLKENNSFKLLKSVPILGQPTSLLENKTQEFYPNVHETEGFFIVKLKKMI